MFTIAENRLQLEEILYQSAITAHKRILGRPLHICIVLDLFIWNGSCVLDNGFRVNGLFPVCFSDFSRINL